MTTEQAVVWPWWARVAAGGPGRAVTIAQIAVAACMVLAQALVAPIALAHGGGTPRLVEEPAGSYEIFAWTNPEPARVGTFHITVALVEPATDRPVLNAEVEVHAVPAGADATAQPIVELATHENATIKTYYETDLDIPVTGPWQMTVAYTDPQGSGTGSASFLVEVQEAGANWAPITLGAVLVIVGGGALMLNRAGGRWLRK